MKTETVIKRMLKENTGSHFLDSGGAYGRHHEKNQAVHNWDKTPEMETNIYENEFTLTVSVYHFLKRVLFQDAETEKLNRAFSKFCNRADQKNESWAENLAGFCEKMGWPQSNFQSHNTYNGDCLLSQTLQFWFRDIDGLLILQVHGGCDVRGGYTRPRFFKCDESIYSYNDVFCVIAPKVQYDPDQIEIIPELPHNQKTILSTYDGYNWYDENGTPIRNAFAVKDGQIYWQDRLVQTFYA